MRTAICSTSDNTTYTFEMPAGNVTVEAVFEFIRNVRLAADTTFITSSDTEETDHRNDASKTSNVVTVSGGKITLTKDKVYIASIDASKYVGRIRSAKLKVKGNSEGNGVYLKFGKFDNYIDFDENAIINNTNYASFGSTARWWFQEELYFKNAADTTNEYEFTNYLRSISSGKVTLFVYTSTTRDIEIKDCYVDLVVEEETIPASTTTIHKVYVDAENGTELIDGDSTKYAQISTDTVNGFVGDSYTVPASYSTTAIDDSITARYIYKSGITTITLAATNDIYLVYDRYPYTNAAFSITVPEGLTTDAALTVPVVVTGTPATATGVDTAVNETVNVTIAQGETTGTASTTTKILPGTYTYAIEAVGGKYLSSNGNVSLSDTNNITLEANNLTSTTATVKYLGPNNEVLKTDATVDNLYATQSFTLDNSYIDDVITVPNAETGTFKRYLYNAEGSTLTINELATTGNEVTVKYSNDGIDYYAYQDFAEETTWNFVPNYAADDCKWEEGALHLLSKETTGRFVTKTFTEDPGVKTATVLNVKFDWKTTVARESGRASSLHLRDSSGNEIFSIRADGTKSSKSDNGGAGLRYAVGASATNASPSWTATNTVSSDWFTVDLTINFTTKTLSGTIKKTSSGDTVATITGEANNIGDAANLTDMYILDDYTAAHQYLDNIIISVPTT